MTEDTSNTSGTSDTTQRYAAFISYAHADEVMAARLHKALETYPVPKHLRRAGRATKPVFRDVAELTAAHSLSEKIREAVKSSRVLIVLCSPAAKASHWVNEEIRLFRDLHGDAAVLSAIIDGTPEMAFPDALTEGGREPLAAALGTDKSGFKLGVTQLAAGMLGTGLDDLVRRESKRRNRLMGTGLAASLALSGIMGFTTLQAVEARNEAELERSESEALLQYMIKDLKVKLEPVGRLELLEGVGRKAVGYYDKKEVSELSDDNLTLLAAARQVLAQVALDAGRMEEAQSEIEASAALTREVLDRNPDDTDAIFAHAQSEFWVGKYYFDQNKFAEVEAYWQEYNRLSQRLHDIDPNNFDWIMEAAWSANAMGAYYDRQRDYARAAMAYSHAAKYAKTATEQDPNNPLPRSELANILAGQLRAALYVETYENILPLLHRQSEIYDYELQKNPQNVNLIYNSNSVKFLEFYDLIRFRESLDLKNLKESIASFERLVEMDPTNLVWAERNISAKFSLLDYYYDRGDISNFNKTYPSYVKAHLNLYDEGGVSKQDNEFIEFTYELSKIRYNFINNSQNDSLEGLSALNKKYHQRVSETQIDVAIYSFLMIDNETMGLYDDAKHFAKKYINSASVDAIIQKPSVLFKKTIAYTVLKDCSTARRDAQNLTNRGFSTPLTYRNHCRPKY